MSDARGLQALHRLVQRESRSLMQYILGVFPRAQKVAAERQQPRLIAGDECLECSGVAASGERDESLVGLQPKERRTAVQADAP